MNHNFHEEKRIGGSPIDLSHDFGHRVGELHAIPERLEFQLTGTLVMQVISRLYFWRIKKTHGHQLFLDIRQD